MTIQGFNCTQCGSSDFDQQKENYARCSYCLSLYLINNSSGKQKKSAGITIISGANVVFVKNTNVTISSGFEVE